jgi:Transglutaminase-like superfamily
MIEQYSTPEAPSPRKLRDPALAAAARLLGDDSPTVMRAVRAFLIAAGADGRDELRRASERGDAATRMRARAVLRSFEVERCLQQFVELELDFSGYCNPEPLLAGAVFASHMVRTFAPDATELRRTLRREADALQARFAGRSLTVCARLLSEHLHGSLGFRGGDASCLDLDHVLLDRVIDGRLGVPVSLSLVYLLVARWAGLSVSGVGMPGHFLVRLHGVRPVLVDPYYGGRTVTKVDCIRYLKSLGYDQVRDHLRDLSDRELLAHYLRELRRAAGFRGCRDAQRTLGSALLHLDPN